MSIDFNSLIPHIEFNLRRHHSVYRLKCKGELWEEVFAQSLIDSGHGSDWKPDYSHKTGKDQVIDIGDRFGNKSGEVTCKGSKVKFNAQELLHMKPLVKVRIFR